jgi:hypothetical protein
MNLAIPALFDENTFTVSYLVSDPKSPQAVIIDPVRDFDPKSARTSTRSARQLLDRQRFPTAPAQVHGETHDVLVLDAHQHGAVRHRGEGDPVAGFQAQALADGLGDRGLALAGQGGFGTPTLVGG